MSSTRKLLGLFAAIAFMAGVLMSPAPQVGPVQAVGGQVTAPSAPELSLNTAGQDPGNFVLSGFNGSDTLLVSVGFVNPPSGTTFALPVTTGLTAGFGYNFVGGKTQISFTGSMANANAALAAMTVTTGATNGTITIRVSASVNTANLYYNPINGHYYEYVARANTYARSATTSQSAFHLAETNVRYGVKGYLATITDSQEQKFILSNLNANNIWIGATDDYELLNQVLGAGTFANQAAAEGNWYWASGPEAGTKFWQGASSSGLWVNSSNSQTLTRTSGNVSSARYENWCSGNSSPDFVLSTGRSMGEPNDWGGAEHYALEKWSGSQCWNDYGTKDGSPQSGYLVEYSENWGSGANARGSYSGSDVASAEVTAIVDNTPKNVTASRSGNATISVSWTAPAAGTVTSYTVTSTPGSKTCTVAAPTTTCPVGTLTNGTSYTFVVVATFNDSTTKASLASAAVVADDGSNPTATLTSESMKSTASATARSNETGTLYLVKDTVAVSNVASITGAAGNTWNSASVATPNSDVSIPGTGLIEGDYKAYAVDPVGNLSTASTGTVAIDDTAPTVTLSVVSATSITSDIAFRITGNEPIDCSTISQTNGVDFVFTNISSIESVVQTSITVCTINAKSTATAGGGAVTSTLTADSSFGVSDIAGNTQTTLTGSPKSIVATVPTTTTTSTTTTSTTTTSTTTTTAPVAARVSDTSTTIASPTAVSGGLSTATTLGQTQISKSSTTTTTLDASTTNSSVASSTSTATTTTTTLAPVAAPLAAGGADVPLPQVVPPAEPGSVTAVIGGEPVEVTVERRDDVIIMKVAESLVTLEGRRDDGSRAPLDSSGSINASVSDTIRLEVTGFAGESNVDAWVLSDPVHLGQVLTTKGGTAEGVFQLPTDVETGNHRIVMRGTTAEGKEAVVAVGLRVASSEGVGWSGLLVAVILAAVFAALFLPAVIRRRRSAGVSSATSS
ncbi:MAG: fibronectin type III domain-containing protein [Actinomycetota bacterium]